MLTAPLQHCACTAVQQGGCWQSAFCMPAASCFRRLLLQIRSDCCNQKLFCVQEVLDSQPADSGPGSHRSMAISTQHYAIERWFKQHAGQQNRSL